MASGAASVCAKTRRIQDERIARARKGAGTFGSKCVRGAISARPAIKSGSCNATDSAIAPPNECPTSRGGRSNCIARTKPATRRACAAMPAWLGSRRAE
jgi:hypothetical protein